MDREEFLEQFSSRTLAYHPEFRADDRPVVVLVGPDAHTPAGHLLLVSLFNLLARAHTHIVLVGELGGQLLCVDHFGLQTLESASVGVARAINPFIKVVNGQPPRQSIITLGIGTPGDITLGCTGWTANLASDAKLDHAREGLLGASLAACLGASTAFHAAIGATQLPGGDFSLWHYGANSDAQGPDVPPAIDVGRVLQVGAGAVGCALDYWLMAISWLGSWTIADGDLVDVSNLNRQVLFLAKDAGFDRPTQGNKARIVAGRMGSRATPSPKWYGDDSAVVQRQYDLVLALANERNVRPALQARAQTVLLHATTTPNWAAIAHRHVAGVDDCIACRLPGEDPPSFRCSTAAVGIEQPIDASLPFLSALAGLLLLRDVIALQTGRLMESRANFSSLDLREPYPFVSRYRWVCRETCRARMPAGPRLALTEDTRFGNLDGERITGQRMTDRHGV